MLRIFCNKCASNWCIDCYINIFRTNKICSTKLNSFVIFFNSSKDLLEQVSKKNGRFPELEYNLC